MIMYGLCTYAYENEQDRLGLEEDVISML